MTLLLLSSKLLAVTVDVTAVKSIQAGSNFIFICWGDESGEEILDRVDITISWQNVDMTSPEDLQSIASETYTKTFSSVDDVYGYNVTGLQENAWYFLCFRARHVTLGGSSESEECRVVRTSDSVTHQRVYSYSVRSDESRIDVEIRKNNDTPFDSILLGAYIQSARDYIQSVSVGKLHEVYTFTNLTADANYTVCVWSEYRISFVKGSETIEEKCEVVRTRSTAPMQNVKPEEVKASPETQWCMCPCNSATWLCMHVNVLLFLVTSFQISLLFYNEP